MELPKDAAMLLSVINTRLRDFYGSLDELCEDTETDKDEIIAKLGSIGYEYSEELNRFV